MVILHRLAHEAEPFYLNPDLIQMVEGLPDTVISLTTGAKIVVAESPGEVAARVHAYRTDILASALGTHPRRSAGARGRAALEGLPGGVDYPRR